MVRKGFHVSYLGGHSIIHADPYGGGKKGKLRRNNAIVWAPDTYSSEAEAVTPKSRLLKSSEVNRLRHVRPRTKSQGIRASNDISFAYDTVRLSEETLGLGKKGFGKFAISTNLLLLQFGRFDLAEIAILFNKRGWKTLTYAGWNATLVGVFIQRFGSLRPKIKAQMRRSKPIKLIKGSK